MLSLDSCPPNALRLCQSPDISRIVSRARAQNPEAPASIVRFIGREVGKLVPKYDRGTANPWTALETRTASCIARMALVHVVSAQVTGLQTSMQLTKDKWQLRHGWNTAADKAMVRGAILDNGKVNVYGETLGLFNTFPVHVATRGTHAGQSINAFLVNQLWEVDDTPDWTATTLVRRDENSKFITDSQGPTHVVSFAGLDAMRVIEELCTGATIISEGRLPASSH